jgi:hypothetical protein
MISMGVRRVKLVGGISRRQRYNRAMSTSESGRRQRAVRRAEIMSIRKGTLGSGDVDLCPIRGADAITLAIQLSREAFSLAGQPSPQYERSQIPVHFVPRRRT